MSLYDYGLGTLAQYELTADRSARTRGALLCYTTQGLLILREFHGSEKKLEKPFCVTPARVCMLFPILSAISLIKSSL